MQKSLTQFLDVLVNCNTFKVCPSENERIRLEDTQSNQEHEILDLPSGAFAIKCPKNQHWAFRQKETEQEKHKHKEEQKPYGKICDYLIFIPQNGDLTVVFCELKLKRKLGESVKKNAAEQIIATIPLFHYLLSAIETHFGKKWEGINRHYALIARSSGAEKRDEGGNQKLRTKEGPAAFYEWPKNMRNPDDKIRIDLILDADEIFPISAITERRKPS